MSRFQPVFLKPEQALHGRSSQTLLRHYSGCPRAGYLYQAYKKQSASTAEMVRGSAVHLVHERAVRLMLENGEVTIPEDIVKDIADQVLAELPVPFSEHDSVREMAYRMASEIEVDPASVISAETLFALDVTVDCPRGCNLRPEMVGAGEICESCHGDRTVTWEVRCRIDFAELLDDGARVHVEDLKSSKAAVSQEEIARKRPDGSLAAKSFQLVLYAIALAYGVPIREETCATCAGTGWLCAANDKPHDPIKGTCCEPDDEELPLKGGGCPSANGCGDCLTKGRVEIREPFPVASRAQHFDLEFVYPAIEGSDGKMLRRPVSLTRVELEAYRVSLAGLVGRLARSEVSGEWDAVVSDAACGECPASIMCPIPKELKDHRGTVNTVREAAEAFEVREREKKVMAAKSKELGKFVKANGPVRFGGGMVAEIGHTTSVEIKDKEGFMDAVDRTAQYGEPLERWRFVKEKHGYPLVVRALTVDELSEGSNDE